MFRRTNNWLAGGAGVAMALLASSAVAGPTPPQLAHRPTAKKVEQRTRAMAERFVENKGQWNAKGRFLAATPNLNYWITDTGLVFDYFSKSTSKPVRGHVDNMWVNGTVVRMNFRGAKAASTEGVRQLRGRYDYINSTASARGVHSFGEVVQRGIYPGVDVRSYLDQGRPRYDMIVAPNADPSQIRMAFQGVTGIKAKGNTLTLGTKAGSLRHTNLFAYQLVNGRKRQIPASFVQRRGDISFALGAYDRSKELVIDPLVYGSYFGGNGGFDEVTALVADPDGGVYMTGWTRAVAFPIINGPYSFNLRGAQDAFITRFQGDAYNIDYSAFVGGLGNDIGNFIALDPQRENVWMVGTTTSTDLVSSGLVTPDAFRTAPASVFMLRFHKDADEVLVPQYGTYFGPMAGASLVTNAPIFPVLLGPINGLRGFAIAPNGDLVLGGVVSGGRVAPTAVPLGGNDAFVVRFDAAGKTILNARQFGGNQSDDMVGVVVDSESNAIMAGTIVRPNNVDLSLPGNKAIFETTPGVYPGGRLLRKGDLWVAKISPTGQTLYSAVFGGSADDRAFALAIDSEDAAYIVGGSSSFDFPRTRGVLGENSLLTLTATKIRPDVGVAPASQIVYSTGLNAGGTVQPVGAAVDAKGNLAITGIVDSTARFTDPPATPPNPDAPLGHVDQGNVMTSADALKGASTSTPNDVIPSQDAWLNVIDPTASRLVYGTYIGGDLDETINPPFVDSGGDIWIFGTTMYYMRYVVPPRPPTGGGTPPDPKIVDLYSGSNGMPANHITALAFKPTPEPPFNLANAGGLPLGQVAYGLEWSAPFGTDGTYYFPDTVNVQARLDGYVMRFRLNLPTVTSVSLNPPVVAGGLGSQVTGTVTLGAAAPAGGADVVVSLSNTSAANFPGSDPASTIINIPAGQTAGTFTIDTKAVTIQTGVNVTASYEGNFKVALLTVVPWLQAFSLSPNTLVGGNSTTGRVTLAQAAPIGGVTIDITTDTPTLVGLPATPTVTVPEGQTTATFVATTNGVATQSTANVTTSLLGANRTAKLTLNTANLLSLTFDPATFTGLGTTTGTLTLDGKAGSTFTVNLSGLPASYNLPPSISFAAGQSSRTFTITAPLETTRVVRSVTASRPAQGGYRASSVAGGFTVVTSTVKSITIDPTTVESGGTAVATVELTAPAPLGDATVQIIADPNLVTVPSLITIPEGATSATFDIRSNVLAATTVATIKAQRGSANSKSATLTIQAGTFAISLDPTSVLGGNSVTGTVVLGANAGPLGFKVNLSSSNLLAAVVSASSVTVPAGESTATFTVASKPVQNNTTVTITGSSGSLTSTADLTVRANGVDGITITPNKVRGGSTTVVTVTVTLEAAVTKDLGQPVTLTFSNGSLFTAPPAQVTVPKGASSVTFTLRTRRVSRDQLVTITASTPGASAAGSLTIVR